MDMIKVNELRTKRGELWEEAKKFLNEHQDANGILSAEDTAQYERMEKDLDDMGAAIDRQERADAFERQLNEPTQRPIVNRPEKNGADRNNGLRSKAYMSAFWTEMRDKEHSSYDVRNALQIGELSEGGYTVPDEFEHQLVEGLQEENIMRGLVHVIRTSSGDRKIPIVAGRGTASWVEEEAEIPESDPSFGQITLSAHKLARICRVSEELLHDSAFDMASFIVNDFSRCVGDAEEAAILTGDGSHKPTGLLHDTLGAQTGITTASGTAITADELIDLQHSLKSGYRRRACWIMNDATVKLLRKLKDGNGQYLWQPGLMYGNPDTLLNQQVKTSGYMPLPAAGNKAILYGDYSYYWLADREGRSMQRLNELYAVRDQVGFKITERLDGRLILPEAVKCLQMKSA